MAASHASSPIESMAEERQKATFNVRELTYFLDEGEKFTLVRQNTRLLVLDAVATTVL